MKIQEPTEIIRGWKIQLVSQFEMFSVSHSSDSWRRRYWNVYFILMIILMALMCYVSHFYLVRCLTRWNLNSRFISDCIKVLSYTVRKHFLLWDFYHTYYHSLPLISRRSIFSQDNLCDKILLPLSSYIILKLSVCSWPKIPAKITSMVLPHSVSKFGVDVRIHPLPKVWGYAWWYVPHYVRLRTLF